MEQNLNAADRYFRLATGIISIASATGRRQSGLAKTALLSFGAMKIAEGVTGWCPMQYASQLVNQSESQKSNQKRNADTSKRTSGRTTRNQSESTSSTSSSNEDAYLQDQDDAYGKAYSTAH